MGGLNLKIRAFRPQNANSPILVDAPYGKRMPWVDVQNLNHEMMDAQMKLYNLHVAEKAYLPSNIASYTYPNILRDQVSGNTSVGEGRRMFDKRSPKLLVF